MTALRTESRQLNDELYRFHRLSPELKQSSDHLTKFAWAYASTGDEKWLNLFNYVLSVRNGSVPLPKGNEYECWDAVAQNKLLAHSLGGAPDNPSLLDRMRLYINPLSQLLRTVVTQFKREDYAFTITQTAYAELHYR